MTRTQTSATPTTITVSTALAATAIDDRRPGRAAAQRRHRWATTSLAAALTVAAVGFAASPASAGQPVSLAPVAIQASAGQPISLVAIEADDATASGTKARTLRVTFSR